VAQPAQREDLAVGQDPVESEAGVMAHAYVVRAGQRCRTCWVGRRCNEFLIESGILDMALICRCLRRGSRPWRAHGGTSECASLKWPHLEP
jgi:hypothetical protein